MFASKLWPYAEKMEHHAPKKHHGPTVKASKEEHEEKDKKKGGWPKPQGTCPVMLLLICAIIAELILIKTQEKYLAQIELYKMAQAKIAEA